MKLGEDNDFHLSYCTNIHPGESWAEVFDNLVTYLPPLKQELNPDGSFGVGLRLSNRAAEELLADERIAEFKDWLADGDFYVYTINGFPYGSFHREVVKDRVYAPDWRERERVAYTKRLARILAELLPEGVEGGISTSPISYKLWMEDDEWEQVFETASRHMAEVTAELVRLRERTGRSIHIDIEPEPNCLLENSQETVSFFTDWLHSVGRDSLAGALEVPAERAGRLLREHVRVCYDTCHFAVEYEDPAAALQAFQEAGIRVGKIQISSALRVVLPETEEAWAELREKLRPFSEAVYLHQVIERRDTGELHRYPDLDVALIEAGNEQAREWRIHYHVPIFIDRFDSLASTQEDIVKTLKFLREHPICSHLEIETYTWDVLPETLKTEIVPSIRREYEWVLSQLE